MATSGSKSVKVTDWDTLKFSWSEKSQDITNNKTTINWTLQLVATEYGYISSSASKTWNVTVNGTKYSGTTTVGISNNSTKTLASGTTTITHNSDGTKSFDYSFSQEFDITFNGWVGTISGSGSGTLDTIPRKSTLSVSNGTLGVEQTLTITEQASSFAHKVYTESGTSGKQYILGSSSATSTTLSFKWTPPASLARQNTSGTSVSVKFTLETYNGSTLIGSNEYTKSFTIPDTAAFRPSCSLTLDDISGWDDTYGSPVQGLSKIKIKVNTTLSYDSPIVSYSISANGAKYTTAEATTEVLKSSGSSPITVTVKDKRGRTGTASYTMNVQAYNLPRVTALTVHRVNGSGVEDDQGNYISAKFSAAITSLNSKNTATYTLRYKKSTDSQYTSVALTSFSGSYSLSNAIRTFSADGSFSYDVEVEAKDSHGTATRSTSASTAFTLMNWGADGDSMGIFKVAEKRGYLEVGQKMEVENPIELANGGKVYLTLTSDFKNYSDNTNNRPWCRKTAAGVVEVHGAVSPTKADNLIATDTVIMTQLPVGYRPAVGFYQLCQGTSLNTWLISVAPDGTVGAQRYRNGTTSVTPGTTTWLPFHLTFIADQ